jgi:lipid-binding SYLF domain-containing protein
MRQLLITALIAGLCASCGGRRESHEPLTPATAPASPQQALIDESAMAVRSMRGGGNFPSFDYYAERARAVLIFPSVHKGAFLVGGAGGKGVLLARSEDGTWSAPAFYGIGSGGIGLQFGYQRASVVLFLMNEQTLRSVLDRGLTLGVDATVAAGTVGTSGKSVGKMASSDVVQLVEAGGVFAGVSLDGAVVAARNGENAAYYGSGVSTHDIVISRAYDHAGTSALKQALTIGR